MASKTQYLQKKLLDHALGKASYTMPAAVYVGLLTSTPGELGSQASEVAGGSYARVELTSKMDATVLATGVATSNAAVTFPTPSADWGTVAYIAIFDAASAGNMLYYQALAAARVISLADGVAPFFDAGYINILSD